MELSFGWALLRNRVAQFSSVLQYSLRCTANSVRLAVVLGIILFAWG
jgi:hypothetical protein